jgi:hypothetical protein
MAGVKGVFIMADMSKVRSASDATVVINSPETMMVKTWNKRNAFHFIARDVLLQSFYNSSLEYLVTKGLLVIEDKEFLKEVGLLVEDAEPIVMELTQETMKKCLGAMPLWELEKTIEKLSEHQIQDLAQYAIEHRAELKMDRIELLGKASHKNILKAIELYKASQED